MHNKAMWFRYFMERSGPKRATLTGRFAALVHDALEPRETWRTSRPSVRGLRRVRSGR